MICQLTKPHPSGTPRTTDIITYRYNDKLVYVPLALDYNQALTHARDAFPQLKGLRDAVISLSLTAPGHAQKFVGISAPAWPKLIAHMTRYQVIDVHVISRVRESGAVSIPDITITYADAEDAPETEPAPPAYHSGRDSESDAGEEDEKASYPGPRPRSPSVASTLQRKRSWFFQKFHGQ